MTHVRRASLLVLVLTVVAKPASAQQPIRDSAAAATAAAQPAAQPRKPLVLTGAVLGAAGGTAIVLGLTALRTADSTSGNAPPGSFDACEALRSNQVYGANQCDVLKGPNKAVVIGGVIAAATGVSLALVGSANSSVEFGPGRVRIGHRLRF